jgi:tryptophanyl-tRNA synthetase
VDITYNYLRFFMEDDKELEEIAHKYKTGKMLTGEIKKILIKILQKFVLEHQEMRKGITMEDINKFMSTHQRKYLGKTQ